MKNKKVQYTFYFAGELFDHKDLVGNKLLADTIFKRSKGKFKATLPQDHEQSDFRSVAIRNQDLKLVLEADLALFNFDNGDVDSGTTVEFIYAKMLDLPSVIIRTDFRSAGDGLKDGDSWNLMLSNYPRTEKIVCNSMSIYQKLGIQKMHNFMADSIIEKFNRLIKQKSIFKEYSAIFHAYQTALSFPGQDFSESVIPKDENLRIYLDNLIFGKIKKDLYKVYFN